MDPVDPVAAARDAMRAMDPLAAAGLTPVGVDGLEAAPIWSANVSAALIDAVQRDGRGEPINAATPTVLLASGARGVVVDGVAADGDGAALLAELEALGLQNGAAFGAVASGVLPLESLPQASLLGALSSLVPAAARANVGAAQAESDAAAGADMLRAAFGLDGAGVKIGLLSDSFDTGSATATDAADDVLSGDLPGPGNPNGFTTAVEILDDSYAGTSLGPSSDEGRAMAQIIHDIAPGAELAFHTAFTGAANFANGVLELAAAGADVIVDDVSVFSQPFYQDGVIAQAVDQVVAQGVVYLSSAGNFADEGYEADYAAASDPAFSNVFHDFDPGAGVDTRLGFEIPAFGNLALALQWDDPFASAGGAAASTDLGLALLQRGSNAVLAATNLDNIGGDAFELISVVNEGGGAQFVDLAIFEPSGTAAPPNRVKFVQFGSARQTEFIQSTPTLFGHAAARDALAVGAAFYADTPAFGDPTPDLQSFSAAGPATILFDEDGARLGAPEIRSGPAFVAADGVNTTFFGADADGDGAPNFFGTSAAAPAAAAVAALLLEAEPDATPDQIAAALAQSAIDMGPAGLDDRSGAGLIQAPAALDALQNGGFEAILSGTDVGDRLEGGPTADLIVGGLGGDTLIGGAGGDRLEGGDGLDFLFGDSGDDRLIGGSDTDALFGGADDDLLFGDEGLLDGSGAGDNLDGGSGDDTLYGEGGNDFLYGLAGGDQLFGGADTDALFGGDGDDRLFGEEGGDSLDGGPGADEIDGGDGVDFVLGGAGNDTVRGGAAIDALFGGADDDALFGGGGGDNLDGGDGIDRLFGEDGVDFLYGQAGSDLLDGGAEGDALFGGPGADELIGGLGADGLDGGEGADILDGGAELDFIAGGPGADVLRGGAGDGSLDVLIGGAGADVFVLDAGVGEDQVFDFEDGIDRIGVSVAGVSGFAQLEVAPLGQSAAVVQAADDLFDGRLLLVGADASIIGAEDFIFDFA